MTENNNSKKTDLKTQVLNDFLVIRREGLNMRRLGAFWPAITEFRALLSGTPFSPENYTEADKIIAEIDKIEQESYKQRKHTRAKTVALQENYRAIKAKRIFHSVLRRTTQILQAEGYFDVLNQKYGLSMTELDKIPMKLT